MSKFEESRWADSEFSRGYREEADIFLPFRRRFIETAKLFYEYCTAGKAQTRVLDLGCGDGLFIQELFKSFSSARAVLVDGSPDMLDAAKERLGDNPGTTFIQASFQELFAGGLLKEDFDFVYSSLAAHHLSFDEKKKFYSFIYQHLLPGGYFIHYDVVDPVSQELEKVYLSIWRQWIKKHSGLEMNEKLLGVPDQFKGNPDNIPDTLESQLEVMTQIGFQDAACYLKYGIFSLFGGYKSE